MTWLQIVSGIISTVSTLVSWLRDRQIIEAGKAEALSIHLQAALNEIREATEIGINVDARNAGDPGKLRDDKAGFFRD